MLKTPISMLETVKDTFAIMNGNDWNTFLRLKLESRQYTDEEKEYLNKSDEALANAKLYRKELMKPGSLVSSELKLIWKYDVFRHRNDLSFDNTSQTFLF